MTFFQIEQPSKTKGSPADVHNILEGANSPIKSSLDAKVTIVEIFDPTFVGVEQLLVSEASQRLNGGRERYLRESNPHDLTNG